jgi:hypothetical protein
MAKPAHTYVNSRRACWSCYQSHVTCTLTEDGCLRCLKRGSPCVLDPPKVFEPVIRKTIPHTWEWKEHAFPESASAPISPSGSDPSMTHTSPATGNNEDIFADLAPLMHHHPSSPFTRPQKRMTLSPSPTRRATVVIPSIEIPLLDQQLDLCRRCRRDLPRGTVLPCAHTACQLCLVSYVLTPVCHCGAFIQSISLATAAPLS